MIQRVGGNFGVKLCFYTAVGRALVKPLPNRMLDDTLKLEVNYMESVTTRVPAASSAVTLF